jgi:hypothetical protein
MKALRVTAFSTRLPSDEVARQFEKSCGGATWRITSHPIEATDAGTLESYVARSSLHMQSIQLEILDPEDADYIVALVHPS